MFDNMNFCDLRVVGKQSGMLERVLHTFQQVVEVPPPIIRGIKLRVEFYRPGKRRFLGVPKHRHDVLAVLSAFTTYQDLWPDMTIIVVY